MQVSIPQIKGFTDKKQESHQRALVRQELRPYDPSGDWSFDNVGYVAVNQWDIDHVHEMYHMLPTAQSAAKVNEDALQFGGMTIQVGRADAASYRPHDISGRDWLAMAAAMNTHMVLYGFFVVAITEPDPTIASLFSSLEDTFKYIPERAVLLPMTTLEVLRKYNPINGLSNWVVLRRFQNGMEQDPVKRIIPKVMVFHHPTQGPNPTTGRLQSRFYSLLTDFREVLHMRTNSGIAETHRAAPMIVTEHAPHTKDPHVNGTIPYFHNRPPCASSNNPNRSLTSADRVRARLSQLQSVMTNEHHQVLGSHLSALANELLGDSDRVDLPEERKLTRQLAAEPPTEMVKRRLLFQEHLFEIFGVPPAMLQTESANGKVVLNSNAVRMYEEHIAGMKQQLIPILQRILRRIFGLRLAARAVLSKPLDVKLTREQVKSATRIQVSLPGIPPINTLSELYQQGILKYDYYKKYLASIYQMPVEAFEAFPKLSQRDLLDSGKDHNIRTQAKVAPPKDKAKPKAKQKT